MRTLIVSDLHLGGLSGVDLLRRPALREPLLAELRGVDRLVLLGDLLELRHGPPHEALAASRPFFEDVGRALGDGEIVVTAGNHDHLLVSSWLDARAIVEPAPEPLSLEQRIAPEQASAMLAQIARWASPARVQGAYPGLWIRPDVYAIPRALSRRPSDGPDARAHRRRPDGPLLERPESELSTVEDYEAITAPIYAWRDMMARYARTGPALNGVGTVRAWRALGGGGSASHTAPAAGLNGSAAPGRSRVEGMRATVVGLRGRALKGAFPYLVSAINRAGFGTCEPEHLRRGAAPRRLERDGRGGRAPWSRRCARRFRPHPSRRPAAERSAGRMARAFRRAADELRQLDL